MDYEEKDNTCENKDNNEEKDNTCEDKDNNEEKDNTLEDRPEKRTKATGWEWGWRHTSGLGLSKGWLVLEF